MMSANTVVLVEAMVARRAGLAEPTRELCLPLAPGPTTAARLVEAVVRVEVASFRQRADAGRLVRVLTEAEIVAGVTDGAVRSGGRPPGGAVDAEAAVATALQAQRDGLVQVVVDDEPVDDLDQHVHLRNGTRVMFLRLVPLAGG